MDAFMAVRLPCGVTRWPICDPIERLCGPTPTRDLNKVARCLSMVSSGVDAFEALAASQIPVDVSHLDDPEAFCFEEDD